MGNMSWSESFAFFVVGLVAFVFIVLGAEFGVFPIVIIAPIVGVISFLLWRNDQKKKARKVSKKLDDFIYGTLGLIVIIFILLWFVSCMTSCTQRKPNTPNDLKWKYKIWRENNPKNIKNEDYVILKKNQHDTFNCSFINFLCLSI